MFSNISVRPCFESLMMNLISGKHTMQYSLPKHKNKYVLNTGANFEKGC
jgi:hypothetical protein